MFYSPCVNWKWLLCVTFYIPFPNIYVCIEPRCKLPVLKLFEEEKVLATIPVVCQEKQRGDGRFLMILWCFELIAQTLSLGLQIHKQHCIEQTNTKLEVKIKLTWKVLLRERVDIKATLVLRKFCSRPTGLGDGACCPRQSMAVLWSRALYPQAVTSSENEMSDVGHSQHFVHAKQ